MVNKDVAENTSLALSVLIVGLPLLFSLFFALIFVPKIRKYLQNLINLSTMNWLELQLISSFAYFNADFTDFTLKLLRANRFWVFFNFFNVAWDKVANDNPENFLFTEWSSLGIKNIFTILVFLVIYLTIFVVLKIFARKSEVTRFFEFEAGLQIVKISTFSAFLAGCIEVYRLVDGSEATYSTGIVFFIATGCFLGVPLFKLLYLRLKYLGNLDSPVPLTYFGSDYRAYKACWREFHIIPELSCLLISAASITFLDYFSLAQKFLLLSTLFLFSTYTILIRPFKEPRLNIQHCISRSLITLIFTIITIHHYYNSDSFLNYSVLSLLLLYFSLKLTFLFYEIHLSLEGIKQIMDSSDGELLKNTDKEVNIKNNENDFTIVTTERMVEEPEKLLREASQSSSKVRVKRGVTGESNTESIDPRLTRKRVTRKKKIGNI